MSTNLSIDVLIVGGGPNGLMLACELGLAGVRPVMLERLAEPSQEPKANGMVGQVIRLLDHRGLYQRFGGTGIPQPVPGFMFGALPLELHRLADNPMYAFPIPQRKIERILTERAVELGVDIRRGQDVLGLSQDADGVTVDVRGPDGVHRLRTRYLVGADGAHSVVRKAAGVDFPGLTSNDAISRSAHVTLPESLFVPGTGELDVPGFGRVPPLTFTRTENGVFVFATLEPGRPTVTAMEWGTGPADEDTPVTLDEIRAAVRRVLGVDLPIGAPQGPGPHLLRRLSGRNTRLADRYRSGRVLLVGDAAHVHSAMGGPGLNLGVQDAVNLGWKLAGQIQGWAPAGLLDTYQSERRPVGERVVMYTQAQSALVAPGGEVSALRELFGELLTDEHNIRRIAELMSGADVRYDMGALPAGRPPHPLVGRFVPELALVTADGPTRVAELMRRARPILLDLTGKPGLAGTAAGWRERVDRVVAECPAAPAAALLIRPDGYVAWASDAGEPDEIVHSGLDRMLNAWFGAHTGGKA